MLRVLLLSTDLQKGGYPLRLARLASALPKHGVEPIVGCLSTAGPLSSQLSQQGIETFACDARGGLDATCLLRFARVVRRCNPDLIHAGLFHANLAARLFGRVDRPRPVITSTVTIEIERRWHRWLESLTVGGSDAHVANSPAVAEHLVHDLGFPTDRLRVIRNGLDLAEIDAAPVARRAALGLADEKPLIVWAGRMDPVKGLDTLVEAISIVRSHVPCQAVLIGDGPEAARVRRLVDEHQLQADVRLAGWRDDVVGWLKAADLLLFPSRTEGSPNTVLEAMACGCAVVGADIAACRELIEPGRDGWLCPVGDAQAFAETMVTAVREPALRRRMTVAARTRIETNHRLDDVVSETVRFYRELA